MPGGCYPKYKPCGDPELTPQVGGDTFGQSPAVPPQNINLSTALIDITFVPWVPAVKPDGPNPPSYVKAPPEPVVYQSEAAVITASCTDSEIQNSVSVLVAAGFRTSLISVADANNQVIAFWTPIMAAELNCSNVATNVITGDSQGDILPFVEEQVGGTWLADPWDGDEYLENVFGTIYYNTLQSVTCCDASTQTVPANTYISAESQEAVDAYALSVANAACPVCGACTLPELGHSWVFNYAPSDSTGGGSALFTGSGRAITFTGFAGDGTGVVATYALADTLVINNPGDSITCRVTTEVTSVSGLSYVFISAAINGSTGFSKQYDAVGVYTDDYTIPAGGTLRIQVAVSAGYLGVFPNIIGGEVSGTVTIGDLP